jgi:hypothetical protein
MITSLFAAIVANAQQKNSWDGAIESLAGKIAAAVGARAAVHLSVKNVSSLDAGRVADFTSQLEAHLRQRGLRVDGGGGNSSGEAIDVTIAENVPDIVFAAIVRRGDSREIELETLDRVKAMQKSGATSRVRLERDEIWSQRDWFLDFLEWTSPGDATRLLFVLEPRRLVIYRAAADGWQVQESHPLLELPPRRDTLGFLNLETSDSSAKIAVQMQGERCVASLTGAVQLECGYDARPVASTEREFASLGNACGVETLGLSSGSKDWTQADALSVVEGAGAEANPAGVEMAFSGPIRALRVGTEEKTVRVIWRDLVTGDYEAGIVTVACGD